MANEEIKWQIPPSFSISNYLGIVYVQGQSIASVNYSSSSSKGPPAQSVFTTRLKKTKCSI